MLLPGLDREAARDVLDRVRRATPGEQTVSIGFAERADDEPEAVTLHRAGGALYVAKEAGRDRVMADVDQRQVAGRQTALTVTGMALMTGKPVMGS